MVSLTYLDLVYALVNLKFPAHWLKTLVFRRLTPKEQYEDNPILSLPYALFVLFFFSEAYKQEERITETPNSDFSSIE